MSKADDAFIRQFTVILVILVVYVVGTGFLGVWIAADARNEATSNERATLERIAPAGRVKLGEPGQRSDAGTGGGTATAAAAASATTASTATGAASGGTAAAAASGGAATTTAAAAADDLGTSVYQRFCFACHLTSVAESPKTGDTQAWAPRAAQGFDALYQSVLNGKGAMPPRAGFPQLTDEELKAGIRYMLQAANVTAE